MKQTLRMFLFWCLFAVGKVVFVNQNFLIYEIAGDNILLILPISKGLIGMGVLAVSVLRE